MYLLENSNFFFFNDMMLIKMLKTIAFSDPSICS